MAIFGKKKDKPGNQTGNESNTASPSIDGTSGSRDGHGHGPGGPQGSVGPSSHAHKGSLTGTMGGAAGIGSGFGPQQQQQSQHPPPQGSMRQQPNGMAPGPHPQQQQQQQQQGPPGAASGFKFGGPPPRQDMGSSGIPAMGSQMRGPPPPHPPGPGIDGPSSAFHGPGPNGISAGPSTMGGPGPSGLPPQSTMGPPIQVGPNAGSAPTDKAKQPVVYPWSQRGLTMNPPRFLDESRQAPPGAQSPSPFPRYGHAANQTASTTGEVYLFGGLVRDSVKNDLYTVHCDKVVQPPSTPGSPGSSVALGGVSATLVQTTGEIPPPRVGHATVLVSNVLILWGGDTKVRADDKQDEGLYLLNLSTREWTRVRHSSDTSETGPVGRYGHSVSIVGSRFYVFGGQVDGAFLDDFWSFDLNSLKSTPRWERMKPTSEVPPKRTGHASVTYKDKIYVFGGTDGQYHYNDTWCYDVTTNAWKELSCIGYIPVPREGHATCLVDDVMYIFGGRGVDGKDLGDLASFKISNQRWYMFANMGPSPSGRSGHALTTYQNKVIVLGGESFTGAKPDDPSIVYVLDTGKIKYPTDNTSKNSGPVSGRKSTTPGSGEAARAMSPTAGPERAISPTQKGVSPRQPNESLVGLMQSPNAGGNSAMSSQQQQQQQVSPQQGQQPGAAARAAGSLPGQGASQDYPQRTVSPTQQQALRDQRPTGPGSGPQPAIASAFQQGQRGTPTAALSGVPAYTGPRSQRSLENLRGNAASPPITSMPQRSVNGVLDRGASPVAQDGFHYGAGQPSTNGYGAKSGYSPSPTTSTDVESMKKREAWMKAALAMAVKRGFVAPDQLEMPDGTSASASTTPDLTLDDIDTGVEGSDKDKVIRAIVTLKTQLSDAKATIAQQAQSEADRVSESDRARSAALQEAAFYRAKLHAIESDNPSEVSRLERERTGQFEKQLSDALKEGSELERRINRLREELKLEQQLRMSAEERLSETAKRAMAAEGAQMKAHDELASLQKRTYSHESMLRDHKERVASLSSLAARHQADHEAARSQLDEANTSVERHAAALSELQAALTAATARSSEHERLHFQHRDLAQQHEATIHRLRTDLQAKSTEADGHASRATELESVAARHREEADTHRTAASNGLAQLLILHQQAKARHAEGNVPAYINDKIRTLTEEVDSLRQLHNASRSAADSATTSLQEMRDRNTSLEKQHSGLRSELSAMRSQLAIALQEVARIKDQHSSKELELRDRSRAVEAAQVKTSLLRQFMVERGLTIPGDEELSAKSGYAEKRIKELEEEIDARSRELQEAEHRLRDASGRAEELQREVDHLGSGARGANGASGGEALNAAERRAKLAEREVVETTNSYKERMAQLENDYQTAVQFVKGSEKMLRRMKDEVTKYKSENAQLQSELAALRSGSAAPGTEGREAAKDIEALRTRLVELTQQSEEVSAENRELERRLALLISEQKDFHDKSRDLQDSHADSNRKANELEAEVERLEGSLLGVRRELQETLALNQHLSSELGQVSKGAPSPSLNGTTLARDLNTAQVQVEQLKAEKSSLAQRLQDTEDKFQLLLGRMESSQGGGVGGASADTTGDDGEVRDSQAFSITSELDKWERDRTLAEADPYTVGQTQ